MIVVNYEGPVRGAYMLAKSLEGAGAGDVVVEAPLEKRGAVEELVQVTILVGEWAAAGIVGGAAFAAVQHAVSNFLERHPAARAEVKDADDGP